MPTIRPLLNGSAYDECIADLVAASRSIATLDPHLRGATVEITFSSKPESHPLLRGKWSPQPETRECGLLVVSTDVDALAQSIRGEVVAAQPHWSDDRVQSVVASYACQNFELEVSNLLLLANVCRPGALATTAGFAYLNDRLIAATSAFHAEEWCRASDAANKYKWPYLKSDSVATAWRWLASAKCLEDGIARGPLGRALASLTYVASEGPKTESSLNLVWILLALEALYCSGNVGLREQLVAKSELVLGRRVENKRAFGAMYDFRSRFLHGDMDLPLRYSQFNAVPAFERHYDDLGDYEGLGLAALIATLQVMIRNNWRGLAFGYEVQGVESATPPTAT